MSRQKSKRQHYKRGSYLPPFARLNYRGDTNPDTRLIRVVDDESQLRLNRATEVIRGRQRQRRTEETHLTLVYPEKIERARPYSRLGEPPTTSEVIKCLGSLPIQSFKQTVTASILDVRPFPGSVGVIVDYDELGDELRALNHATTKELGLRSPTHVTPGKPHITVAQGGGFTSRQIRQIESSLPATIDLSPIKAV